MKRIFTLLLFVGSLTLGKGLNAQPLLVEDFNYSGALTANGWSAHSGAATNPISTTTGLTYAGYANSNIGNAALVGNAGGEDDNIALPSDVSGNGTTIYYSVLVNVNDAAANKTGDYIMMLGDRVSATSFTNFSARIYVKITADVVNFGLSNTSTPTYGTTAFAKNTTYLLIVKYTINTGGNDPVSLWVLSSGVPGSEAAAGTPELNITTTSGQDIIDAFALRQGSNANQPQVVVDGLRISTTWWNAPLPINLLSFNGSLNNNSVSLSWATTNEVNTSGFEIQRSANGRDFSTISFVSAKGATNNSYSLLDEKSISGTNYYRLKMVDKDGSVTYSQVVSIKTKSIGIGVYPNPVKGELTVQHEGGIKGAFISVVNFEGKEVMRAGIQVGATQTSLDATKLAPGTYMIIYNNNGERLTKQFVKQ